MQLSITCPGCGKGYELPWSLVGKKARCKVCGQEFPIAAPYESRPGRSSEAIPVAKVTEATTPRDPRPKRPAEPAPLPPIPVARIIPPPSPIPVAKVSKNPSTPSPIPESAGYELDDEGDSGPDWHQAVADRNGKVAPSSPVGPIAKARSASSDGRNSARPPWLIPVAASVVGLLFLGTSVGLFLLVGRRSGPVEVADSGPEIGKETRADADSGPRPPTPRPSTTLVESEPPSAEPVAPPKSNLGARKLPVAAKAAEDVPSKPMNTEEIVAKFAPSVALIKGKKGSGTGFVVRSGIVATNAHVIGGERARDLEVRFPSAEDGKQGPFTPKILFQDKERDLAFLAVGTDLPPVEVAEGGKIRKGEDVTVIGNPGVGGQMVLENAISPGNVSTVTKLNNLTFIQLGISINPGNSGGPVFNPKGQVIGVVTLKTTKQEGLAFAIPAEDLRAGLATAEATASRESAEDTAPATATKPGQPVISKDGVPTLAYGWKAGKTYVYAVDLVVDAGSTEISRNGYSIYQVKAVDPNNGEITLDHSGWFITTKRSKDGAILPGGTSNREKSPEITLKIDPQGEVQHASGASPLSLLGDFAMLLIEPLPDDRVRRWDDSRTIALTEVEQVPGGAANVPRLGRPGLDNLPRPGSLASRARPSLRGRPSSRVPGRLPSISQPAPQPQPQPQAKVILHEATEDTKYILGDIKGGVATFRKDYEMATREVVGDQPRVKMSGRGNIGFDLKEGVPVTMDYVLNVVENSGNATFRLPIKVNCRLVEGKEREMGLRPSVYEPTANNKLEGNDLARLLADLKSPDNGKRQAAYKALADAKPVEARRGEVCRALGKLHRESDIFQRGQLARALGVWGDDDSLDDLFDGLKENLFGSPRDQLYEAVTRLSPTARTASRLIPYLLIEQDRASKALRAIGAPAEAPLLKEVEDSTDPKLRAEACRVLKDVGSSESVPILEQIVQMKGEGDIGRNAQEALNQAAKRWPTDAEWTGLLKQARSPDGRKRRGAVDRISVANRVEARQPEVARALESLLTDVDGGTQALAFRALTIWGDAQSRGPILDRLDDPDLLPVADAIAAIVKLGPDERAVRSIAGRIKKDRGPTIEALASMGPIAEGAAIEAFQKAGDDWGAEVEFIRLLGKIGTPACLPTLRGVDKSKDPFGESARAIGSVEQRAAGGSGLKKLVGEFRSGDDGRRKQAVEAFARMKPIQAAREQVARGLDELWEVDDLWLKQVLREAVVAWGDDKSADVLTDLLAQPDCKQWEEALHALVVLRPDAKTAELLGARFAKDPGRIGELARKMPLEAEKVLLAIASGTGELRTRVEACAALARCATPASSEGLKTLAKRSNAEDIARVAEEALAGIKARQQ